MQNEENGKVQIFDSLGRMVTQKTINGTQDVHFSNFTKGTYLAKITYGSTTSNHRIIVQ